MKRDIMAPKLRISLQFYIQLLICVCLYSYGTFFGIFSTMYFYIHIYYILYTKYRYLTTFESWDSGEFFINILLIRMYFNQIFGAMIVALSYYLLANPYLFAIYPQFRNYFALQYLDKYPCLIDQVAVSINDYLYIKFAFFNTYCILY